MRAPAHAGALGSPVGSRALAALATGPHVRTIHLRARGSGIETDVPTAAIATWREGLLIDWKDYAVPGINHPF
jgi:hypothetical protein